MYEESTFRRMDNECKVESQAALWRVVEVKNHCWGRRLISEYIGKMPANDMKIPINSP